MQPPPEEVAANDLAFAKKRLVRLRERMAARKRALEKEGQQGQAFWAITRSCRCPSCQHSRLRYRCRGRPHERLCQGRQGQQAAAGACRGVATGAAPPLNSTLSFLPQSVGSLIYFIFLSTTVLAVALRHRHALLCRPGAGALPRPTHTPGVGVRRQLREPLACPAWLT